MEEKGLEVQIGSQRSVWTILGQQFPLWEKSKA
jgi:hypothetical protein